MRIWITGDDSQATKYLMQALGAIDPTPVSIPIATFTEYTADLRGTVVLGAFRRIDEGVRSLVTMSENRLGEGSFLLFTSSGSELPHGVLAVESIHPAALRHIVSREIRHVEMRVHLARVESEREAARRMGTELISGMAHDLRAPLNSIVGFSELLEGQAYGELSEKQARYAANIGVSGRALLGLIDDIVDLSRIDTGKVQAQLESVELPSLIEDAVRLVKEKAQKHRVRVVWEKPASSHCPVRVDSRRFRQAIYLLLSYRISALPEGSEVHISIEDQGRAVRLRFAAQRQSTGPDGMSMSENTPLPTWQQLYIEHVCAMHDAELVGWRDGAPIDKPLEVVLSGRGREQGPGGN